MKVKAHMIVTVVAYSGDSKNNYRIINQVENWLKQLREMPDNLDKIGNFLYSGEEEPQHEHYDNVKFLLEIEK